MPFSNSQPAPGPAENAGKNPANIFVMKDVAGSEIAAAELAVPAPAPSESGNVTSPVIEDVIEACQRGEQDAFQELFETYQDRVYSIALRYSGDPSTAMDIAQDTFVKLMSRIQQFRGDSSFESWLYRMVVNGCLDHGRRNRRWMPLLDGLDEVMGLFRSPERGALAGMLDQERASQIQQVVAKLPPEQKIVVVLRYTEGLSYDEIADALQVSTGTVASRLNRAHKALERRLGHLQQRGAESASRPAST